MQENIKKYSKQKIIVLAVILLLIGIFSFSYAYWTISRHQESENKTATSCISLTMIDNSKAITLDNAFPISDEDGMATDGYTFTLTNNCKSYVQYDINLENLNISDVQKEDYLDIQYINATLDDIGKSNITNYPQTATLLSNDLSYDTRKLGNDMLNPAGEEGSSKQYTLKLWLDKDAPMSEMSKKYQGKISIYGIAVKPQLATDKLIKIASASDMIEDDTKDDNLRYVGADPDNYVEFNDELWRIIGVMNNVKGSSTDDGSGETRIKLIRNESLGEFKWDDKDRDVGSTTTFSHSRDYYQNRWYSFKTYYYSNDWSDSQLMMMLNPEQIVKTSWEDTSKNYTIDQETGNVKDSSRHIFYKNVGSYYNRMIGYKPAEATTSKFTEESVDFSNSGLTNESKKLIDTALYTLGSPTGSDGYSADCGGSYCTSETPKEFYKNERSKNVHSGNPITWTGYIGLLYPSDYGFATAGSHDVIATDQEAIRGRDACLMDPLLYWGDLDYKDYVWQDCVDNDWLVGSGWTISPTSTFKVSWPWRNYEYGHLVGGAFSVYESVDAEDPDYEQKVKPVVYLKASVNITSGNGTKEHPYKLAL